MCEQMEGCKRKGTSGTYLEDVARLVGDEEDVEVVKRLVDVTNVGGFDGRVLRVRWDEGRERGQERFDACTRHFAKLARHKRCGIVSIGVTRNMEEKIYEVAGGWMERVRNARRMEREGLYEANDQRA